MKKRIIVISSLVLIMMGLIIGCSLSKDNKLVMGTYVPYPPFEYTDETGLVGIDIDIAKEIGRRLNKEVDIQLIEFDRLPNAVQMNKVDMVGAALTVTDERKEYMDFTSKYILHSQSVLVVGNAKYQTVDDLKENQALIGVESGTTCLDDAQSIFDSKYIKEYLAVDVLLDALNTETVDAIVLDNVTAKWLVKNRSDLRVLTTFDETEGYAFGVSKTGKYSYAIKETFDIMLQDGTIEQIINKYLGQNE